jgi:hypothetical protein
MPWKIFSSENLNISPDNDKKFIYHFYTDLFQNINPESNLETMLNKHFIIAKRLISLSNTYTIKTKNEKVTSLFYKEIPLDLSADNYLFLKFMKFHSGFIKFNEWYGPNSFEEIDIDNSVLNDYIARQFYACLEKNKVTMKDKALQLQNFELISSVCVKERLTFFNYLIDTGVERRLAREFINSEYMKILKKVSKVPSFVNETKKINLNNLIEAYNTEK